MLLGGRQEGRGRNTNAQHYAVLYFGVHSLAHGLIKCLLPSLSTPRRFAAVEMDVKNQGLHQARVQPPERASKNVQCRI